MDSVVYFLFLISGIQGVESSPSRLHIFCYFYVRCCTCFFFFFARVKSVHIVHVTLLMCTCVFALSYFSVSINLPVFVQNAAVRNNTFGTHDKL